MTRNVILWNTTKHLHVVQKVQCMHSLKGKKAKKSQKWGGGGGMMSCTVNRNQPGSKHVQGNRPCNDASDSGRLFVFSLTCSTHEILVKICHFKQVSCFLVTIIFFWLPLCLILILC